MFVNSNRDVLWGAAVTSAICPVLAVGMDFLNGLLTAKVPVLGIVFGVASPLFILIGLVSGALMIILRMRRKCPSRFILAGMSGLIVSVGLVCWTLSQIPEIMRNSDAKYLQEHPESSLIRQ